MFGYSEQWVTRETWNMQGTRTTPDLCTCHRKLSQPKCLPYLSDSVWNYLAWASCVECRRQCKLLRALKSNEMQRQTYLTNVPILVKVAMLASVGRRAEKQREPQTPRTRFQPGNDLKSAGPHLSRATRLWWLRSKG